ncbi:MAG: Fic family protein [Balneolaceae bacterium]
MGKYYHWDKLQYLTPPEQLTIEELWMSIKLARSQSKRSIHLLDTSKKSFYYTLPDLVLEKLHFIDRNASGAIELPEPITNPETRDRYIQSSLIEEAITSSQLEGAATTREVAKEMIKSGRKPMDTSELMILNNYKTMKFIKSVRNEKLTPALIKRIHFMLIKGVLDEKSDYFRQDDDGVRVYSDKNEVLHNPPHASEIKERLEALCNFANSNNTNAFLHPVIKAIILHFWMAYDHPFIDGNGRTARALFYWCMLQQNFWLFEYISISTILKSAPAKYGMSFLHTETDENDLTYFILHQLEVIVKAIEELREYLQKKMQDYQKTVQLLNPSSGLNHRQIALLGHALKHPWHIYSIESHKKSHGVTYQTARTDLLNLLERKLLEKFQSGKAFQFRVKKDLEQRINSL